jgi:hypothetical protein
VPALLPVPLPVDSPSDDGGAFFTVHAKSAAEIAMMTKREDVFMNPTSR